MPQEHDTIAFWLDVAGRYDVLPQDQVLLLARQIQKYPVGSKRRQRAIDKLVKHNLKLIPRVARKVMKNKYGKAYGTEHTLDALQCGVIGLHRAAELYDPEKGYAFSTYATPWIFQAIQRDLYNNASMIRIPETTIREYYGVLRNCKSKEELAAIDPKKMARYMDAEQAFRIRSLNFSSNFDGEECEEQVSYQDGKGACVVRDEMADLVALSDTSFLSKKLLLDYYEGGMSITQISKSLNMCRNRVSNLINECTESIRENLAVVK